MQLIRGKKILYTKYCYFQITGIILLSIGIVIHGIYHNYQHFLDNKFLSVPSLLIAIGAIIFFIAFFGCCGAVRENYCMIITVIYNINNIKIFDNIIIITL